MCAALGIRFRPRSTTEIDPAGADLVARRDRARVARDWGEADSLRRQLESAGWVVEDGPEGTRIRHR
jgi:cysteinyl-tRNA synthetase